MSAGTGATTSVDPEIAAVCERADRDAAEDFCRAARIDILAFNRTREPPT